MEINARFGKEPEFFNIDEEIRKLLETTETYGDKIKEIEVSHYQKHNEIRAHIQRLNNQLNTMHDKHYEVLRKARAAYEEDMLRLNALRRQKEEEAKNKMLDDTVLIIKEICDGYEAWTKARDYQIEDVVRIVHQYLQGSSGIMNANEMALGKTYETLLALKICMELHRRKFGKEATILWLTKLSIVKTGGTFREAKRWFPELKVFPVGGSVAAGDIVFEIAAEGGICVLTNYETIKKFGNKIHWDFLVMDEVHKLKGGANSSGPTAIWETIKGLSVGFQMMLTGTPLVNKMEEIWSYLHLFDPNAFPDAKKFARQFNAFKDMSGQMKFTLQSEKLMKDILKGRLIRRTASEVGLQLPPIQWIEKIIPHNPQQGEYYAQMRDRFFIWLDKQEKALPAAAIIAQLMRLRQINVLPVANFRIETEDGGIEEFKLDCRDSSKLDEAMDIVLQTQDQVIIGCNFNEPMEEFAFRCQVEGLVCEVISSAHGKDLDKYEVGFQQKKIDVLCVNLAMGEGLNLHKDPTEWPGGARAVIYFDKWWNNMRNDQFYKRAVRPSGDARKINEPVFIYDLKCENSVDFFVQQLCDDKALQFQAFTESSELRPKDEWKKYLKGLL